MDILKEELNRTKELMGLLYEQGSGSNAPESFSGSGKSCAAGYMWSIRKKECVKIDSRYVRNVMMNGNKELYDLEDELRNVNTLGVMIKNVIEGLHRWQQSRKSEKGKYKNAYYFWEREVKDKFENDIRKYIKDVNNRVINSEVVTKILSALDEKIRETIIKNYVGKFSRVDSYVLDKIDDDIRKYIKHYIGEKDGVEKFMRRWNDSQKKKEGPFNWGHFNNIFAVRNNLGRTIVHNL